MKWIGFKFKDIVCKEEINVKERKKKKEKDNVYSHTSYKLFILLLLLSIVIATWKFLKKEENFKKTLWLLLWMGFSCLKAATPLRGGSLFFTTKFPEVPGTHLIDIGRKKGWVDLGATQWFWTQNSWIGNSAP